MSGDKSRGPTYKFELPPGVEQLQAIGMVAVEWAALEDAMSIAIGELSSYNSPVSAAYDPEILRAMTAHLNARQRLELLVTLFNLSNNRSQMDPDSDHELLNERRMRFEAVHKSIDKLGPKRNQIVHAHWIRGLKGSPMTVTVSARKFLRVDRVPMPVEALRDVAQQIHDTTQELLALFDFPVSDLDLSVLDDLFDEEPQ